MTETAGTAAVTESRFLTVAEVAELVDRPTRTVTRWCALALRGEGPLAGITVRRLGRPYRVSAAVATLITPEVH